LKDWREDYVICEHVKENDAMENLRHKGFRVCCIACFEIGFLDKEIVWLQDSPLSIAKIKEEN